MIGTLSERSLELAVPTSAGITLRDVTLRNGVRLGYAERGPRLGPVVLMLHGLTDSWFSFSRVLPLLPKELRVIAVDQRGHGESDRPASGYTMDHFAVDLLQLMDALNICIHDNGDADYANLHWPNTTAPEADTDSTDHDCDHEPLPEVVLE